MCSAPIERAKNCETTLKSYKKKWLARTQPALLVISLSLLYSPSGGWAAALVEVEVLVHCTVEENSLSRESIYRYVL